ncbi:MAG TPA: baseplate J/gp47 family protein [Ktedonobacteraceae bacterium]|nr:baseplate J/gp47 family protein [Ktedonobacteraceae bacterium]
MSDEQMIYIDPDDDLTNVRTRLEGVESRQVTLVIPAQTQLRSHVAWKLLHARARELGKDILIISTDPQIRSVAQAVKFRVAPSLEAAQESKPRPATRPGRTNAPAKGRSTIARSPRSRQLPPSESWSPPRSGSSQSLEGQRPRQDANRTSLSPSNFRADERPYDRAYEYRIETTPPIMPLASQPIEDPDLLLEDVRRAEGIREAASQEGVDEPDELDQSLPSSRAQAEAFRITPRPLSENPFDFMDEKETGAGRLEQQGQANLHNYDTSQHAIQDVSSLPIDDSNTGNIEFEGDLGDFVIHSDIPSKTIRHHSSTEPTPDDEEDMVGPARTYGVRPHSSRSGQVPPLPRSQNIESEDALPPIEDRNRRTPRTSRPLAGSRADPLTPRTSKPLPGNRRSDAMSSRASRPLPPEGRRSDAMSSRSSRPLQQEGRRSDALPSRSSRPLQESAKARSGALQPRTSRPLQGSRSDAMRVTPLDNRTEMQPPLRERPRPASRPLTPQEVARSASPAGRGAKPTNAPVARSRSQRPPIASSRRRGLNGGTLFVIAIILIFIFLAVLADFVPSAEVRVGLPGRAYTHAVQLTMTAQHATSAGMVAGTPFTHNLSLKGTGTASGTARVGTNSAHGSVIFTNNSNTLARIPTGVVVTTSTNVQFVTLADAVAPPKGGPIQNVEIPVQAVKPGDAGNVPPGSITIIPDNSINQIASYSQAPANTINLSVSNTQNITGGGVGNAPQVRQQDLANAQATLSKQLQANFMSWLKTQITANDIVGQLSKTEKLANQPPVGQILPSGTSTFALELQGSYSVLVLRNADVQTATRAQLNSTLLTNKAFAGFTMANDAPVTISHLTMKSSGNKQILNFTATGQAVPMITTEAVKSLIANKSLSDARLALQKNIKGPIQVEIKPAPGFVFWVPFRSDNIQVHFFAIPQPAPGKTK